MLLIAPPLSFKDCNGAGWDSREYDDCNIIIFILLRVTVNTLAWGDEISHVLLVRHCLIFDEMTSPRFVPSTSYHWRFVEVTGC